MTEKFFADTNVVVYALDANEQKRRQALAIMRQHPVISTQVVNEFLNVLLGKRKMARAEAYRLARVLMRHCDVMSVTPEITEQAMTLGERYSSAIGMQSSWLRRSPQAVTPSILKTCTRDRSLMDA